MHGSKRIDIKTKPTMTRGLLALLLTLYGACTHSTDNSETGETGDTQLAPCETPLSIFPGETFVNPYGYAALIASGGTGDYVFTLESDDNGSEVQLETGAFVAGPTAEITERVLLSDRACAGSASAEVHILPSLQVSPESITLPTETGFTWNVAGGSGEFTVDYFQNHSGGSLGTNSGTSGTDPGYDVIHIVDSKTEETVAIRVYVDTGVAYTAEANQYILPLGASIQPKILSGSGVFDASVLSGGLVLDDQTFIGDTPGLSMVKLTDRHVPTFSTTVAVTVSEPLGYDTGEAGGLIRQQNASLGPGDLNGDGYPDAILGNQELHIGGYNTGGALVYAGAPDGLIPNPVQVLAVSKQAQRFGYAMVVADFNLDGHSDLAVSAPYTNGSSSQNGAIYIYYGVDGGFFEEDYARVLIGKYGYDRLGISLDACDINGDGQVDLIAGAPYAEDRAALTRTNGQGAVHVFLNQEGAFLDEPDHSYWGQMWDGSAWSGITDMNFGATLSTGDFNGDGQCDIASGGYNWAHDGSGDDGGVFIYSGLDSEPYFHAVYEQTNNYGDFGRTVTAADFDGDGADELIVGALRGAISTTLTGASYVFWISEHGSEPNTTVKAHDADWLMYGDSSNAYFSKFLGTADVTDDGVPDLIISATQDELPSLPNTAGVTLFMDGAEIIENAKNTVGPYDATADTPLLVFSGAVGGERFGQTFTPIGDVTGDGVIDFLAYSATDSSHGVLVGAPYFIDGGSHERQLLNMPVTASGATIGLSGSFYDVDNSGQEDALVSAQYASHPDRGSQSGHVSIHLDNDGAWEPEADQVWTIDALRSLGRYGWDLSPIGDFNNDGYPDMAILSLYHQPGDFSTNPDGCPNGAYGSVFIHLGSESGLSETPAFRIQAPSGYNYLRKVVGEFDFDGDSRDDILISNYTWSGYDGGFLLVSGRDAAGGETVDICDGVQVLGHEGGEDLGYDIAPIGDLNGDMKDEVAIAAKDQGMGITKQGVVWVLWGGTSPETSLTYTPVGSMKSGTSLGSALAGGEDVDGDDIPDLIVSAYNYSVAGNSVGGIWLLSGAYLSGLPTYTATDKKLPLTATVHPHVPSDDLSYALFGTQPGGDFGVSVSLVPSPNPGEAHWVAVGTRYGSTEGVIGGGTAEVYRWEPGAGFDQNPEVIVATESGGYNSNLGASVAGGRDAPVLLIGSSYSHAIGLAQGAAYAATLQPTVEP